MLIKVQSVSVLYAVNIYERLLRMLIKGNYTQQILYRSNLNIKRILNYMSTCYELLH